MNVSVAIATYNGGRYLREQLDSIRRQTLPPGEVVICDDGSSDDTLDVARQFAAEAPFKVIVDAHGLRLGFTENFFRAINHCTGEIVALCDQDDVWFEGKLAAIVPEFADPSVATVTHRVQLVDEHLTPTGIILPEKPPKGKYVLSELDPWSCPNGMQLLFRRAAVTPWLRVEPPLSAYGFGTAPFDERIFLVGTLVGASVVIDDVLGVWRRHAAAMTTNIETINQEDTATHKLHLALHSGGEAYAFRADVTDTRAEFAARAVDTSKGSTVIMVPGAAEFYRRMSRMFRRRVRLHDPTSTRLRRLFTFGTMVAHNDYRRRSHGGLGAKAVLKDGFTIFFGPRTPMDSLAEDPASK